MAGSAINLTPPVIHHPHPHQITTQTWNSEKSRDSNYHVNIPFSSTHPFIPSFFPTVTATMQNKTLHLTLTPASPVALQLVFFFCKTPAYFSLERRTNKRHTYITHKQLLGEQPDKHTTDKPTDTLSAKQTIRQAATQTRSWNLYIHITRDSHLHTPTQPSVQQQLQTQSYTPTHNW